LNIDFNRVIPFLNTHPHIRWIFSDIDGTLMHPKAIAELYAKAAHKQGVTLSAHEIIPWLGKVKIQNPQEALKTVFNGKNCTQQQATLSIRQYETDFLNASAGSFERFVYPEVPDCLHEIQKRGIHIGIITNRYEQHATKQILSTSIAAFINRNTAYSRTQNHVICGGNTPALGGLQQQDKAGQLQTHMHRLGITPDVALVVGDQLESDIKAAEAVGMYGVLIERTSEPSKNQASSDTRFHLTTPNHS
jgi:FMN phosphatase YigB (HAD superfamily)